ncbi:hypothetical protein HQN59_25045 [Schlegelella sp. ID0723]|uniref:Uncharacterized protein n=1 Tax=Piscinibacter koreensis TaxID=2742824 RepID=A0A7Y6NTE1_9BURK|nr:hypothetical protein [Schlegelella koreensis]
MAAFQRKGHEQAVAVWERAKARAAQLVQEAKQLAQRLRDVAQPERVKQWVQALVGRSRPQAMGREQEPAAAADSMASRAPDAREVVQPPVGQASDSRLEQLKLAWAQASPLIQKEKTAPLTSADKQQLARGLAGLAGLIDGGYWQASPEQRQAIERASLQAHRRVAADVFLSQPQVKVVEQYPMLAGAYRLLELVEGQAETNGLTQLQRSQELERSRRRIAAAIENGEVLQFSAGKLEVPSRALVRSTEIQPEQGRNRGQEPPERGR